MELDKAERARPGQARSYPKLTSAQKENLRQEGRCFYCRELGHTATACPAKTRPRALANPFRPQATVVETFQAPQETTVARAEQDSSANREALLKFEGNISGKPAIILLDSGASRNYIGSTFIKRNPLRIKPAENPSESVELADGTTSLCQGIAAKVPVTI